MVERVGGVVGVAAGRLRRVLPSEQLEVAAVPRVAHLPAFSTKASG